MELMWVLRLLLLLFAMVRVKGDAMVTGTVFCDQCRDGERSLFDYPLNGAKVAVACGGGAMTAYREESTNLFGSYAVRFDGSPDLAGCYARVVAGTSGCGAAAGPAQRVNLMFSMFGMAMYTVDPLLAQPPRPMNSCRSNATVPRYPPPNPSPSRPMLPLPPPLAPRSSPAPSPFLEASACTYDKWMMPEFKCYWKLVAPDTKVALAFGPVAAGRYGADMTLWEGLHGRGDLYRTLLREGTTALLNSYNSLGFFYPTLSVINHMNLALLGSPSEALMIALRFRRANWGVSGTSKVSCKFSPCS